MLYVAGIEVPRSQNFQIGVKLQTDVQTLHGFARKCILYILIATGEHLRVRQRLDLTIDVTVEDFERKALNIKVRMFFIFATLFSLVPL